MKCKYCNSDIEQDAQFCTNCGKDLSKFNKCIKCGELLDEKTDFCPYCGTEQPHEVVVDEEKVSSKKWIWAIIGVLLVALIGGGYYFLSQNEGKTLGLAEAVDSDSIAVVDAEYDIHSIEGITVRMTEILNEGMSMADRDAVNKFFSKEYREIYYKVEEYDKKNIPEGEIGFWDFSLWGDGQGGIGNFHSDVLGVQNIKDSSALVIVEYVSDEMRDTKMTTNFNLVFEDGNWLINEITDENAFSYKKAMREYLDSSDSDTSGHDMVTISELRNGKSIEAVLSSLDYRHKKVENDRGYVTVYWYKNCDLDNQLEVVKPVNKNASVVEEFDGMSASVRITVFDEQVFEDLRNQTLQYCKKDGSGHYQFDWGDGEVSQGCVDMGKDDFRKGGYYIDIPL